jgi:ribosomal protein S18 acetylase RimI-like enzyme
LLAALLTPNLRPAMPEDSGALWHIFSAIFLDGTTYAADEGMTKEAFLNDFCGRGGEQWLAESEGRILGAYTLRANHPGRGAHVATASYGVDAAARGQGVGLALAQHSLERARALGFTAVQFNFVVSTNTAAVRLWESLGFEVRATLPAAFRHRLLGPVDALVLWKTLT